MNHDEAINILEKIQSKNFFIINGKLAMDQVNESDKCIQISDDTDIAILYDDPKQNDKYVLVALVIRSSGAFVKVHPEVEGYDELESDLVRLMKTML